MVDPPPVICEPCDAPWKLDDRLDIGPDTNISQYTCLTEVRGDLGISGDFSPAQLAPLCHLRVVSGWMVISENTPSRPGPAARRPRSAPSDLQARRTASPARSIARGSV